MVKTVRITTDDRIEVIKLRSWSLKEQEKAIGAECTECVKTRFMYTLFEDFIVMIIDESGALKGLPVNRAGSLLYGADIHGCPIYGDIIFGVKMVSGGGGA